MATKKTKKAKTTKPVLVKPKAAERVNHPNHYGGKSNPYETIKVIEAWGLDKDFCLGNTVKYISRAGKKVEGIGLDEEVLKSEIEDLEKAQFYLNRKIENLKKQKNGR